MSELTPSTVENALPIQPPRIVTIVTKDQIVEVWHVYSGATNYKERDVELPAEVGTILVNGQRVRLDIYRRQLHRQEWRHLVIRRYQATRMLPWTPSVGLAMLIPGTLLAAGSANQGILETSVSLVILQSALIALGSLLAIGSGWRILTQRVNVAGGTPIESLGVSGHAMGFPKDVVASDSLPTGFRAGRFRGLVEVNIPVGEWRVVEEYTSNSGWHPAR